MAQVSGLIILVWLSAAAAVAADWPQFRGPAGLGTSSDTGLPLEVGPHKNVIWKTPLPPGHSSPILVGKQIFLTGYEGETLLTISLDRATGKMLWKREAPRPRKEDMQKTNSPASPTPASDGKSVFVFFGDFGLIAYSMDGDERWRHPLGPFNNANGHGSSPVVIDDMVLLICDQDTDSYLIALDKQTGKVRWVTKLAGQVKGGVALSGNRIFVGDYASHVYALNAQSGRILWEANAQPRFGQSGRFYGTPAVAYGRVYIGATDGKVYSFGASSGKLRWSQSTGGYVYSSPAVWRDRVYVGSYSHRFFCLDAATGAVLWQFTANGPISGSPTILAGRVYFATLQGTTYALDARSGHQVWSFPDGKYSPVVADAKRLYLVGNAKLYGLVENRR